MLADDATVGRVAKALETRGIEAFVANNAAEAKGKVLEWIPKGASVAAGASATMREIGVTEVIEESGLYDSIRKRIKAIEDPVQRAAERRRLLGADYGIGSVQAVTETGQLVAVSASGSQLSMYAFDAAKVILVISTMKIVKDLDAAFRRIYDRALPLENERVRKEYAGASGSSVNKVLIIEKERPDRIRAILVKERLGF